MRTEVIKVTSSVMFIPALCDVLATICDATGLVYVSKFNINTLNIN